MPTRENDLRYYFANNEPISALEALREITQPIIELDTSNKNKRVFSSDAMDSLRYIPYIEELNGFKSGEIANLYPYPRMIGDKILYMKIDILYFIINLKKKI